MTFSVDILKKITSFVIVLENIQKFIIIIFTKPGEMAAGYFQ